MNIPSFSRSVVAAMITGFASLVFLISPAVAAGTENFDGQFYRLWNP